MKFIGEAEDKLNAVEDDTHMYLGRKRSIHDKYGTEGALLFGKCLDKDKYGKLVSLDAISPHVVFICGARGSGKCLLPDEKILLSDGSLMKISDLFKELSSDTNTKKAEILSPVKKACEVLSLDEDLKIVPKKTSHVYRKHINEDIIEIKTRSGRKITATKEHPLLGFNEKPKWKNAEDICVGDYISSPRNTFVNPTIMKLPFTGLENCFSNSKSQIRFNFLLSIKEKSKRVSEIAKEIGSSKAWDIAKELSNQNLINLRHCSPLTASLTKKGQTEIRKADNYIRFSSRSTPIKTPKEASSELMRFFAYMIAEGTEVKKGRAYR